MTTTPHSSESPGPDEDPQSHVGGPDTAPEDPPYAANPGTGDPQEPAGGSAS